MGMRGFSMIDSVFFSPIVVLPMYKGWVREMKLRTRSKSQGM